MAQTLGLIPVVVWHTLAIYLFLILCLSRVGRPLMAERTLPAYLVIALLGSAVETGLYDGSGSLAAGLAAAATLLVANRVLTALLPRSRRLRRLLVGAPVVLVHDGQAIPAQLRRVGLTEPDLLAALRERGYARLDEIRFAVMEVNGAIGIVPRERPGPAAG
ncbi:MAG TPA: YetF domain-containing protein [Thermomicrobiales bacterium]|nr:YetF domain-containing protein [Thermomicrobiales bacterium]